MVLKMKAQAKQNERVQFKEPSKKFMAKVPEENVFWCHDGKVFRSLKDLADGLAAMSDDTYAYHVNSDKNDFRNWVRDVIKDEEMANELAAVTGRSQAAGLLGDQADR